MYVICTSSSVQNCDYLICFHLYACIVSGKSAGNSYNSYIQVGRREIILLAHNTVLQPYTITVAMILIESSYCY